MFFEDLLRINGKEEYGNVSIKRARASHLGYELIAFDGTSVSGKVLLNGDKVVFILLS